MEPLTTKLIIFVAGFAIRSKFLYFIVFVNDSDMTASTANWTVRVTCEWNCSAIRKESGDPKNG